MKLNLFHLLLFKAKDTKPNFNQLSLTFFFLQSWEKL